MKKGPAGTAGSFLLCESQRTLLLGVILFLALFRSRARPAGAPTAAATSRRFLLLLLLARFANQRLARQPHLVALNRKHLDQHLVAQLQLIADVANAMLGNLADVQQAVGARKQLDESAELRQPHHFAEVGLANLRRSGHFAHHLQSGISSAPQVEKK